MELSKKINIPQNILLNFKKRLNFFKGSKKSKGYVTLLNLFKNKYVTLANLKKIKNTIDNSSDESVNLLLKDEEFVNWYEKILKRRSERIQTNKENKERAGLDNPYRKSHEKTSFVHSEAIERKIKVFINENIYNKVKNYGLF